MLAATVVAGLARELGPGHPESLVTLQSLAWQERNRGPEHPETLHTLGNLGMVLLSIGELDEAEMLIRRCLEATQRVLGLEHPQTQQAEAKLADVLHAREARPIDVDAAGE